MYSEVNGQSLESARLLAELLEVLPRHVPARVGMALQEGVIVTRSGYYVGTPECEEYVIANGSARRCGERYLQLAEYAAFAAMASEHPSLTVKLEDERMDLTIRKDGSLLAYLETKTRAAEARTLIDGLRSLEGPVPAADGKVPDHIKKANYLLNNKSAGEVAFAVRAGDDDGGIFDQSYLVTISGRELTFAELADPIALHVELQLLEVPYQRAHACLVWCMEREGGLVLRRGKHGRYLVYREIGDQAMVVVGTERAGSIYTTFDGLSLEERHQLEAILNVHEITLGQLEGQHRMWKRGGRSLILTDETEARKLGHALGALLRHKS